MHTQILRVARALAIAAALALPSLAVPLDTGAPPTITGVISDRSGAGMAGVTITLRGPVTRVAVTGERGLFRVDGLPPGRYVVAASLSGFSDSEVTIEVDSGPAEPVTLTLEPATYGYTMEVIGTAPGEALAASEVRESPGREIADALTRIAGVSKVRKGGVASDVVLRGYQGESVNVLVDGVKVHGACPNNMDPPVFHTDLSEVERVEIGKGPFDMRNAGSLGGVVNLVTRQPGPGFTLAPSLVFGSDGFASPSVTISQAGSRASVQAGLSYRESRPYEDGDGKPFTAGANYRAGMDESDAFRIGAAWLRGAWAPSASQRFQVALARQEADHVLYPYLMMDAVYDDTSRANLSYELVPSGRTLRSLRVQGYATGVEHWMTDEWRTSSTGAPRGWSMGTDAETGSAGLEAEADFGGWQLGIDLARRSWLAETRMAGMGYAAQASVPDVVVESAGIYAEGRLELARGWRIDAGLRWDSARSEADPMLANTNLYYAYKGTRSTEASDSYPSGRLRAAWAPAAGVEISAGIGRTVRLPDPQERYFALRRAGSDWVGNPELEPVTNSGVSLSGRWVEGSVSVEATAFRDALDDYIVVHDQVRLNQVPGVMNAKARSYAATDATMQGAELSIVAGLGHGLFATVDGSMVRATKDAVPEAGVDSEMVAEIPPYSGRAALRWQSGERFCEVEGIFAARQDRVDSDLGEQETPGWGVMNLRGGMRVGWLSLAAAVYNVFDRQYVEHLSYQRDPYRSGVRVPEPGLSLALTMSASF